MLKKVLCLVLLLALAAGAQAEGLLNNYDTITRIPDSDCWLVCVDDLWGVANAEGEIILEPRFRYEPEFQGGYAMVALPDPGAERNMSDENEYGNFFGVIDAEGKIILPAEYENIEISADEGVILAKKNGLYGYMNLQGETIIAPRYDRAAMFTGDYAAVAMNIEMDENMDSLGYASCWGMIDRSGKVCIPLEHDWLESSANGIAAVQRSGEYGYINAKNKTIVDFKYFSAGPFVNGYAAVAIKENMPGTSGDDSKDITSSWGVIDESGREVIPCSYDSLTLGEDGIALVRGTNDLYGYVNMKNETLVETKYFRAQPAENGYAIVGRRWDEPDGSAEFSVLWGLIDLAGREILPMEYDRVRLLEDGSIEARLNGSYATFDIIDGKAVEVQGE